MGTVAQVVGTHGDRDVDRQFRIGDGIEQQLDEGGGPALVLLGGVPKAEQFLELVDHDQQVGSLRQVRLLDRLDQAKTAPTERGPDAQGRLIILGIVQVGLDHRFGQVQQRVPTGAEDDGGPVGADSDHRPAIQRRQQSGPDKRRLAAAGGADDGEEAMRPQQLQKLAGLLLATEEQVVFLGAKRAETGERVEELSVSHGC